MRENYTNHIKANNANLKMSDPSVTINHLALSSAYDRVENAKAQKKAVQARISGQKNRRERNHKLFLAAGLMIDAGLVDTKTGELNFDHEKLLTALKRVRYDLETSA